jgi:hypothetical protein
MSTKRDAEARPGGTGVTPDRFRRLYRLLGLLGEGVHSRPILLRRLRLDLRGFYRDLEALRAAGVPIRVEQARYSLAEPLAAARDRLPFPDPHLSLREVRQLATGRGPAQRKLREQMEALTS